MDKTREEDLWTDVVQQALRNDDTADQAVEKGNKVCDAFKERFRPAKSKGSPKTA